MGLADILRESSLLLTLDLRESNLLLTLDLRESSLLLTLDLRESSLLLTAGFRGLLRRLCIRLGLRTICIMYK